MIDGRNFFDQPIKTYKSILKAATHEADDYTTVIIYLLDYPYFKNHYKIIALGLIL